MGEYREMEMYLHINKANRRIAGLCFGQTKKRLLSSRWSNFIGWKILFSCDGKVSFQTCFSPTIVPCANRANA